METLIWTGQELHLLNTLLLPGEVKYIICADYRRVAEAIGKLEVRGAPAIGAAAAFALVLGAIELAKTKDDLSDLTLIGAELLKTRPTAVNLSWAIERMTARFNNYPKEAPVLNIIASLEEEALNIFEEDIKANKSIGEFGSRLFTEKIAVLTHCNAGALATAGFGTALGVIRAAFKKGNISRVFADETRPLLQGARLTAFELKEDGIPVTLITDNMAGWVMKNNMVQAVVVGADRIALNGDAANKISTYSLAVLAERHNIPFYVAAPLSTFDFSIETGGEIPIEERNPAEVTNLAGTAIAPPGIEVFNPAFDVTPNSLITGIITEKGVLTPDYKEKITQMVKITS